ncbi:PqqD family protein [Synechococcus sp. CS-1324]|uniref:PqqD family protein n=1 Tax=Synechococcus sp. CS-1324 TaxID=2847980 RepID=UPI000DB7BE39|nr:PqqD family protein [Synechococcus sp. CS-1324]MCT0231176.1 PqqD family protein [Synechococcus sp. CS-1324]PZV05117.1 MAG: hypothetical protein DCF23_04100 [Cyanobium sp.]
MSNSSASDANEDGQAKRLYTYLQSPSICAAELDGEICLFNPSTATYLNLNGSASAIWNLIASKTNEEKILAALLDAYDVDEAVCHSEVREFLNEALEKGMVEVHPL